MLTMPINSTNSSRKIAASRPAAYLDREIELVASAILAPDLIERAINICPPAAVSDYTCRTIYSTVAHLEARGYGATLGRIAIHLEATGARIDPDTLIEITESVPTGVHICYFARLVSEAATRRALAVRLASLSMAAERGEPLDIVTASLAALAQECGVAA